MYTRTAQSRLYEVHRYIKLLLLVKLYCSENNKVDKAISLQFNKYGLEVEFEVVF